MKKLIVLLTIPILFTGCITTGLDAEVINGMNTRISQLETRIEAQEKAPKTVIEAPRSNKRSNNGLSDEEKDFILLIFNDLRD